MGFFDLFKTDKKPKDVELVESVIAKLEGEDPSELFEVPGEEFLEDIDAGELCDIVKKMLEDDQVSAEFETFKTFVGNSNFIIQSPDESEELADKYKEYLDRDGGRLVNQFEVFFEALEYGSVNCEVVWQDPKETNGVWAIDYLKPLDHARYGYNKSSQLVDKSSGLVLDTPYKFITVSHNVRGGNLNGNSLLLKAYWPWTFRKACIKAGLLYVKKSVIPSIVAIYKAGKNKTETQAQGVIIAQELSKLANSSGIAMANVEDLKTVDPTSKGTDIINLVELFNRMISKAILGVATLTNDTRYSNRGDTTSQETLIEERAQKVSTQEFQSPINTLLKWTLELNQGEVSAERLPLFKFIFEYDPTFEETLEAVKARVPISGTWFYNKYNIKPPEDDNDQLVTPSMAVSDIAARGGNEGFFFSEQPKNKPALTKAISMSLSHITGKK